MSKNKHSSWPYSDFGFRPALRDFALRISAFGFLCLCCLFAAGCKKSSPADETRTQTTASPSSLETSPVARIHWLGKKRIAAGPYATGFMKIWNPPESAKVEAQTLDKLST